MLLYSARYLQDVLIRTFKVDYVSLLKTISEEHYTCLLCVSSNICITRYRALLP